MMETANLNQERVNRWLGEGGSPETPPRNLLEPELGKLTASAQVKQGGLTYDLRHGAVVIAAITSCTNTSNPAVMLGAGSREESGRARPRRQAVGEDLAGARLAGVTDYLREAGLTPYLEALGFHLVGYGCTTCIGNSGPCPSTSPRRCRRTTWWWPRCSRAPQLRGANQPARAHELPRSPPLVVAYALAERWTST